MYGEYFLHLAFMLHYFTTNFLHKHKHRHKSGHKYMDKDRGGHSTKIAFLRFSGALFSVLFGHFRAQWPPNWNWDHCHAKIMHSARRTAVLKASAKMWEIGAERARNWLFWEPAESRKADKPSTGRDSREKGVGAGNMCYIGNTYRNLATTNYVMKRFILITIII